VRRAIKEFSENGELEKLKADIENARATVAALNKQKADRELKEDFIARHSIKFSDADAQDVKIIKECAARLYRKEILSDILWSIYYQKPLQQLRAKLFGKVSNKVTGIYKITSQPDQTIYIGQAVDISDRWPQHVKAALKGERSKFYTAMREIGPENFTFEVIEECDQAKLNEREKYWIEFYNSVEYGYNTQAGG